MSESGNTIGADITDSIGRRDARIDSGTCGQASHENQVVVTDED